MTIEIQPKNTIAFSLTYLGLLPFVVCTILCLFGYTSLPVVGNISSVFMHYATVIASFMAGTHWGVTISRCLDNTLLLCGSILTAIAVWLLASYASFNIACIVLSFLFFYCLLMDRFFLQNGLISEAYFQVRVRVTIVVVCISIMGAPPLWH